MSAIHLVDAEIVSMVAKAPLLAFIPTINSHKQIPISPMLPGIDIKVEIPASSAIIAVIIFDLKSRIT